jgi:hypothetical protein|tara:strand:+ start:308 stop:481 length:174 start_codon:yes stop_codon:yes gene_type:complete
MSELRSIDIKTSDNRFKINVVVLKVKNYSGVVRKMKGKNVIAIVKIEEGSYMAFTEE